MNVLEFLNSVITSEKGYLLIASRNHTIPWHEEFHEWPDKKDFISDRLETLHDNYDVYFSSHLFNQPESAKVNVVPTRTIQADLDFAREYPLEPSILVQTSPNRFQGYWRLKYDVEPEDLERLSKRLTYAITDSDHSGWSLGHRVRLPGSLNFKYNNGPHPVEVISSSLAEYAPEDIELLPSTPTAVLTIHDNTFIDQAEEITFTVGPFELLESVKTQIPATVYYNYVNKVVGQDRSAALWSLMCSLIEAGLTREQVFWLAKHSVNNKFVADMRYNSDRELAKDVNRAITKVKIKPADVKTAIDKMRNMAVPDVAGGALMKRRVVFDAVKFAMDHTGKFVKVTAGLPYFIPEDTGRPIALTPGSEHYRASLHLKYGINSADPEYKYIHDGIIDMGISIPNEIQESSLSYYDGSHLLLHTGRKDVYDISATGIKRVINGECGVLFPWYEVFEPFTPDIHNPYPEDWADVIFGDLHNTTNMRPQQAKALLKSWLIFSLFRSMISTRPILAFFGPPGSTKSTLPHRIYSLLYSRRLSVSGVTGPADFDSAVSRLPIYCVDNLDTYVNWIIDKLALAIGNSDILKRKLFTDVEVIRQRRQAMVVVTAHNPKFTRADVTSRLLLITLDEVEKEALKGETDIISKIVDNRAALWGAIINDVVRVMQVPKFTTSSVKWRIQDFCELGEWIAHALGHQDDFNDGLQALLATQSDTVIQQEELLSTALRDIDTWDRPIGAQQLWNMILVVVGSNQASFVHTYKNPTRLQQKIETVRSSLLTTLEIETILDPETRIKLWRIRRRA